MGLTSPIKRSDESKELAGETFCTSDKHGRKTAARHATGTAKRPAGIFSQERRMAFLNQTRQVARRHLSKQYGANVISQRRTPTMTASNPDAAFVGTAAVAVAALGE